jgi:ABC-type Fe2+-enterobactin transport system substrate-binding protein
MYVITENLIEAIEARLAKSDLRTAELTEKKQAMNAAYEAAKDKAAEALARGLDIKSVDRYHLDELNITVTPALKADARDIRELLAVYYTLKRNYDEMSWQVRREQLSNGQKAELRAFLIKAKDQEAERPGKSINAPKAVVEVLDSAILNKGE